ncbi:MAG: hypothetical protein V1662_03925 [Candidatus Omnitrophota bacterium]
MAAKKGGSAQRVQGIGLKLILGLILLVIGTYFAWIWKTDLLALIRGLFSIIMLVLAVIVLAMAKE